MKHAFLVMAHENFPLLSRIIKMLDHSDNTVFIHIDAKSQFTTDDADLLKESCRLSKVIFTDRYNVTWGGYSQVNLMLRMLEASTSNKYDYYHFLSGADFLTKPMDELHDFFEKHCGEEFIAVSSDDLLPEVKSRYAQYHFFRELCGRNKKNPLFMLNRILAAVQRKILHIDRTRKYPDIKFNWGPCWCSITNNFAEYLLSQEQLIKKLFIYSTNADEVFLQTIVMSSLYKDKLYGVKYSIKGHDACLRSVDWTRDGAALHSPYVYTVDDYDKLINTNNIFCRKITDKTPECAALIEKLEATVKK